MRLTHAVAAAGLAALVMAAAAAADEDADEVTARTACLGGRLELVLDAESDDDEDAREIEIALRVTTQRPVYVWRIVLVHERRLLYRGVRRWSRPRYSLRLARDVPDWPGVQTVAARLSTGDGRTCRVEASI